MRVVFNRMSESAWQTILPPEAAAVQQSWRYGSAAKLIGRNVYRAEISTMYQRVGIAQVLIRPFGRLGQVGLMSRGPIWMPGTSKEMRAQASGELRRSLPGTGLRLLLSTPEEDTTAVLPLVTGSYLAEVPLSLTQDTMRDALQGKWRNRLVKAENSDLEVRISNRAQDLDWLLHLENGQQKIKGYRNLPAAFLRAWAASGPDGYKIFIAQSGGTPVAAMLFLVHAPGATYQIGWTSEAGRKASAHHLLLWRAMQDLSTSGLSRLDLGVVDTVTTPGLARFKLGTGANLRRLGATGLVVPVPSWPFRRTGKNNATHGKRMTIGSN